MFLSNRKLKIIVLGLIMAGVAAAVSGRSFLVKRSTRSAPPESTPAVTTPQPSGPQLSANESPDGTRVLSLRQEKSANAITYTLSVLNKSESFEKPIYQSTSETLQDITIPFNSWEPDYAHFFLKTTTSETTDYRVFDTSGTQLTDDSQYISIRSMFLVKVSDFVLEDVTGWAAPNLLIVNTRTPLGELGPSYWFEVSSRSFIRLGTRFN